MQKEKFKSCNDALQAGGSATGIYKITTKQDIDVEVFCVRYEEAIGWLSLILFLFLFRDILLKYES